MNVFGKLLIARAALLVAYGTLVRMHKRNAFLIAIGYQMQYRAQLATVLRFNKLRHASSWMNHIAFNLLIES